MSKIISIHHVQTIDYDTDSPTWGEGLDIFVQIRPDFFKSGWYLKKFSGRTGSLDLLIFLAILMHARPLRGKELEELVELGAARRSDEGRLFCWVSDETLSEMCGAYRKTVGEVGRRLAEKGLLKIWTPGKSGAAEGGNPAHVGGRFASKIYVVSGEALRYMSKEVHSQTKPVENPDVPEAKNTPHGGNSPMGEEATMGEFQSTMGGFSPKTAKNPPLIDDDIDDEDDDSSPAEKILVYFQKAGGVLSEKDPQTLEKMSLYSWDTIKAAIDQSAALKTAGAIRMFNLTYCQKIARGLHASALSASKPVSVVSPSAISPIGESAIRTQSESGPSEPSEIGLSEIEPGDRTAEIRVELTPNLRRAGDLYLQREPEPLSNWASDLKILAQKYGVEHIEQALENTVGRKIEPGSLLAYVARTLQNPARPNSQPPVAAPPAGKSGGNNGHGQGEKKSTAGADDWWRSKLSH